MKKMLKKSVIFTVMAALLVTAALLITACMEPLGYGGIAAQDEALPPGMGRLSLSFGDNPGGRTIMPATSFAVGDFNELLLTITGNGTTANPGISGVNLFDEASFIAATGVYATALPVGSYTVTVVGNIEDASGVMVPAASGTNATVTVAAGPNSATVALLPIIDGDDTGLFTYSVTLPAATPDTATMAINPRAGSGTSTWSSGGTPINLIANPDHSTIAAAGLVLNSGFYDVVVTMTLGGHQNRVISEVLHIYPEMTSDWEPTQFADLNVNVYTVTFDENGGTLDSGTLVHTGVAHGTDLTLLQPTVTNAPSTFDGWFRAATAGAIEWDFTTDRVIRDVILYAHWATAPAINLTVSFTIADLGLQVATFTPSTLIVFQDTVLGVGVTAANFEIEITGTATGFDPTSTRWIYGGATIHTGDTLTIDAAYINHADGRGALGLHNFTVEVEVDGIPYSGNFVLNIQATAP